MDEFQLALTPLLRHDGFRKRGRTYNRTTPDGLVQVVSLQMGAFDPPGTLHIKGLRENLHGLFTVNLGVYVPELAERRGRAARDWVKDYDCAIRQRLGSLLSEQVDEWWPISSSPDLVREVWRALSEVGIPFLDSFGSRDGILRMWDGVSENLSGGEPPRIVLAVIQLERGNREEARRLLAAQARESDVAAHTEYVHRFAATLGLAPLPE